MFSPPVRKPNKNTLGMKRENGSGLGKPLRSVLQMEDAQLSAAASQKQTALSFPGDAGNSHSWEKRK